MHIKGKKVTLRSLEYKDIDDLNKWANDPEIWYLLGGWHFPYSRRSTEDWIKAIDDNNFKNYVFGIENEQNNLIGTANLINIDWKNRNAYHGMMLGNSDNRGKGYGTDVVMAIMRYAFDQLGLIRLDSSIIDYNQRSINFYTKKCGWKIEGKKEKWYYRNGGYHDKIIVGITNEQYYEFINKTKYWKN